LLLCLHHLELLLRLVPCLHLLKLLLLLYLLLLLLLLLWLELGLTLQGGLRDGNAEAHSVASGVGLPLDLALSLHLHALVALQHGDVLHLQLRKVVFGELGVLRLAQLRLVILRSHVCRHVCVEVRHQGLRLGQRALGGFLGFDVLLLARAERAHALIQARHALPAAHIRNELTTIQSKKVREARECVQWAGEMRQVRGKGVGVRTLNSAQFLADS
jgi:hypothetical protein